MSPSLISPSRPRRQQKPDEIEMTPQFASDNDEDNDDEANYTEYQGADVANSQQFVRNLARLSPSPSVSSLLTDFSSTSSFKDSNVRPIKCSCHGEFFEDNDQLKLHHSLHSMQTQGRHVCEFCGKSYANKSNLNEHVNTHYGTFITCKHPGCKKRFTSSRGYDIHVLKHQSFTCKFCHKNFPTDEKLQSHVVVHASPKYKCKDCDKTFTRNADLTKHANETCPFREINLGNLTDSTSSTRSTRSSSDVEIVTVVKNITNGKPKVPTKKEKLDTLRAKHDKAMRKAPYSCSLCTKRATTKEGLKIHFRQFHDHNTIYVCQNCLCGFPSRQALFTHKRVGSCVQSGRKNIATFEKL